MPRWFQVPVEGERVEPRRLEDVEREARKWRWLGLSALVVVAALVAVLVAGRL